MRIIKFVIALKLLLINNVGILYADIIYNDSLHNVELSEIDVMSSPKENSFLKNRPISSSTLKLSENIKSEISTLKDISALTPNFFMPDYGSSLTSAIYIRGVGSRINTPAVGLYIDDIPCIDKSAFSFNFIGVESIDILRGPQSTLYGRNTMGGLVHIHTINPFKEKSTTIKINATLQNDEYTMQLSHHNAITCKFAMSAEGFYKHNNGFFNSDNLKSKVDGQTTYGARLRGVILSTADFKADIILSYENTDENGYAYTYNGNVSGAEQYQNLVGKITSNKLSGYKRSLFNSGIKLLLQRDAIVITSISSYQGLSDHMFLDQDFLLTDTFELNQYQHQHTITQEIVLKNRNQNSYWQWTSGAFAYYQWLKTESPVSFNKGGVNMIQDSMDKAMESSNAPVSVTLTDNELYIPGNFDMPSFGFAIYHQSSFNINHKINLILGIRADYERFNIKYISGSDVNCDLSMSNSIMHGKTKIWYKGETLNDYVNFFPKVSFLYRFNDNNSIYTSVNRGFRSGGYNVQMFADIISNSFQTGINIQESDINNLISFKPEYCWNFEIGSHIQPAQCLNIDLSMYYMKISNQQIANFAEGGLGRRVVNAGQSLSYGAEVSLKYTLNNKIILQSNYGYTHASFDKYVTIVDKKEVDYNKNIVPFIPQQTLNIGADFIIFNKYNSFLNRLSIGMSNTFVGEIYWNESNLAKQNSYNQVNMHAMACIKNIIVNVWGKNILNEKYDTFYFESMNHKFSQKGKPCHVGFDVTVKF